LISAKQGVRFSSTDGKSQDAKSAQNMNSSNPSVINGIDITKVDDTLKLQDLVISLIG
jgi:hypothetical protein